MDEKDYELLLDLSETKNITKTASRLYMTQPAITKRIQKMEEELNCQLFLRSKKGVILTPSGESIIPYTNDILLKSRLLKEQGERQEALLEEMNKTMKELSKGSQKGRFGIFR